MLRCPALAGVALALSVAALPGCLLITRPGPGNIARAGLSRVFASADAVRVRSGGLLGTVGVRHATLAEARGRDEVAALGALLDVEWSQRPGSCCTPGDPTLELMRGGRRVASLAVIGDCEALRWAEDPSWRSDLVLTPRGRLALADWLAAHGVPGPKTPPGPQDGAPPR